MKLKVTSVSLPEEMILRAQQRARDEGRSVSGHVRYLISCDLKKLQKEEEENDKRNRKRDHQRAGESHS